jgi:hypothetical protein
MAHRLIIHAKSVENHRPPQQQPRQAEKHDDSPVFH